MAARARAASGRLLHADDAWIAALNRLRFNPPVGYVYNPLDYAGRMYARYVERFARPGVAVVLLGMNPGPWGMAQTGIPFGEVAAVRDWLGLHEPIGRPVAEHPRRPVRGLACLRSEVSGRRLWGWAREHAGSVDAFFERFFIANYCPLAFLEASGRNLTPDKLPAAERDPLFSLCDDALRRLIRFLRPQWVIGLGGFAEARARQALAGDSLRFGRILHPSPASPAANRDWASQATRQLREMGIAI